MSTVATTPVEQPALGKPTATAIAGSGVDTCGVNIRGVPKAIWRRARANALQSGLPFKAYVIKLLERSEPIPPEPPTVSGTSTS